MQNRLTRSSGIVLGAGAGLDAVAGLSARTHRLAPEKINRSASGPRWHIDCRLACNSLFCSAMPVT